MKILFFDMEFANGKVPGSVYSLGYVQTNHAFRITEPQTDLLMNPDCEWNAYVRAHILAYPMKTVKSAALFPSYYKRLKRLLCHADLVVGFAVKNDTVALRRACERYNLKPLEFQCLDMEKLCRAFGDYPQAHGLSGYVRAYCGIDPENQHRSDGDAYATMLLLKAVCEKHNICPKKIKALYGSHMISSMTLPTPKVKKKNYRREEPQAIQEQPTEAKKPIYRKKYWNPKKRRGGSNATKEKKSPSNA